jgi:hypothetical protein
MIAAAEAATTRILDKGFRVGPQQKSFVKIILPDTKSIQS